eukprot:382855-Karenia_brevis.AAC.1
MLVLWLEGYLGVRVGEASNPGPGTWQLASINVTSFSAHFDELVSMPWTVMALQETRLNDWAQAEFRESCSAKGWQLI